MQYNLKGAIRKPTKSQVTQLVQLYTDNMIAALYRDLLGKELLSKQTISTNNRARLKNLKKELSELKGCLHELLMDILEDEINRQHKSQNPPPAPKFSNDESSFLRFIATKEIVSVDEFLKRLDIYPAEKDGYEDIKQVLLYEYNNPIFEIKEYEHWEYDLWKATTRRYAIVTTDDPLTLYESNNLEKLERRLFKLYLKGQ